MLLLTRILGLLITLIDVQAQFPTAPDDTILESKSADGVYISFKKVGIFFQAHTGGYIAPGDLEEIPGVKSHSGYVHLPPGTLADLNETQDYPINTFFWFFEARNDPHNAPLVIWMNDGLGSSSMLGVLVENGPCFVSYDSNLITLNPWSWNNRVNVLYVDQPVQANYPMTRSRISPLISPPAP